MWSSLCGGPTSRKLDQGGKALKLKKSGDEVSCFGLGALALKKLYLPDVELYGAAECSELS